ncbi:MAG: bifunctional DNA primase/polymerase [Rhodocyclaceae bacterium]|nr:bifunctional DNA primase/polymerase [Rhodocyclaceae bacterium]
MPDGTVSTPQMSFKDAACLYLSLGWRVFPLAAGSHVPLGGSNGHNGATTDIKTVLGWWGEDGNLQYANIGIATGRLSGFWVLDVDNHGDENQNGFIKLKALTEANGELPDTVTAKSPRGGLHYYFKVPEDFDISSKAGILGAGLDSRSSGGYIVAPPSIRTDRDNIRYAWEPGKSPEEIEVADTPEWMLTILREQNRKDSVGEHDAARVLETIRLLEDPAFKTKMTSYASKGLGYELEIIRSAAPGTGNDALFRSAFKVGQLIGMELLDEASTRQELLEAAIERGRSEAESRDVIDRAFARGKNLPRALPNANGSTKRPMMPIEEAKERLPEIFDRFRETGDVGVPFERDSLRVFSSLMENDKAAWSRVKDELGKLRVAKRDIDKAVKDHRKSEESPADIEKAKKKNATIDDNKIFFLGKSDSIYYYMSSQRNVFALSRDDHKKVVLLALAPLSFWTAKFEKYFAKSEEVGVDWDAAVDWMFRESDRAPIFDASIVKGVGAYRDGDRVVVNLGDGLLIDGLKVDFANYTPIEKSIFERRSSVKVDLENKMTTATARRIVDHILSLPFESRAVAHAVAGWTALAPLCGMIEPRAHLYVDGASGSGKSTLQTGIIKFLNHNMLNWGAGTTTAAAIRQSNDHDSKPNFVDEFEGNTEKSRDRIDGLLELLRNSFDGSVDKKGSAAGKGVRQYRLTHMYCVSSIASQVGLAADKQRIIQATLQKFPTGERGQKIKQDYREIFGDESEKNKEKLSSQFLARVFSNVARTLRTIDVFLHIMPEYIEKMRGQKMYANLFGALYAFANDAIPSVEEAKAFLTQAEFSGEIYEQATSTSEHGDLVSDLLSRQIIHQVYQDQNIIDRKVRVKDLAIAVMHDRTSQGLIDHQAQATLGKYGMKMIKADTKGEFGNTEKTWHLAIAHKHPELTKMFSGTRWQNAWSGVLKSHELYISGRHNPVRIDGEQRRVSLLDASALFRDDILEMISERNEREDDEIDQKNIEHSMFSLAYSEIKEITAIVAVAKENEYV